jgi:hypothetical protein
VGLAFLPHLAVAGELRQRELIAVEIMDAEPLSRSLDVIHPRQRPLTPEALALLGAVRQAVSEMGSPRRQPVHARSAGRHRPRRGVGR